MMSSMSPQSDCVLSILTIQMMMQRVTIIIIALTMFWYRLDSIPITQRDKCMVFVDSSLVCREFVLIHCCLYFECFSQRLFIVFLTQQMCFRCQPGWLWWYSLDVRSSYGHQMIWCNRIFWNFLICTIMHSKCSLERLIPMANISTKLVHIFYVCGPETLYANNGDRAVQFLFLLSPQHFEDDPFDLSLYDDETLALVSQSDSG